jgi:hypothetical protein
MQFKYQLVFLGSTNKYTSNIISTFKSRVKELGVLQNLISYLNAKNFDTKYQSNLPTVGIYFGNESGTFKDESQLLFLLNDSNIILPVVQNIKKYTSCTPTILHPINGFELKSKANIDALVNHILEGLSLLRLSRRLFISYRRKESASVAIQLFERLESAGFDVFLDTHSVRKGDIFQDELWHRLVDTDVVVLLNTKGFLKSQWTKEELAKASGMSIGILQIIWPNHLPEPSSKLSIQFQLSNKSFISNKYSGSNAHLQTVPLNKIIRLTESLRARSLGARQDNIITEFINICRRYAIKCALQPQKFISIGSKGKDYIIIPTVGIPHAFTYDQSRELIDRIRAKKPTGIILLYDHLNIRERWLKHIAWLDEYLPVTSLKVFEAEEWIKKTYSK